MPIKFGPAEWFYIAWAACALVLIVYLSLRAIITLASRAWRAVWRNNKEQTHDSK